MPSATAAPHALSATGFQRLQTSFQTHADRPLLTQAGPGTDLSHTTYGALWLQAARRAARLAELGVCPGDKVVLRLENSPEHLVLYLACAIGGYVACPVDPALPAPRLAAVKRQLAPRWVCEEANSALWQAEPADAGLAGRLARRDSTEVQGADFLIIMSSGTTGAPKGIVHTLDALVRSAESFGALAGHDTSTVVYHHFPMFYMAGVFNLFLCPLLAGSRIVVGPRFSGASMLRFWELPQRAGVNHLTLTPTMALGLTQLHRRDEALDAHLAGYQAVVSTGSALYPAVAERFLQAFGVPLRSCYGVTEVGGSITLQTWEDALAQDALGSHQPEVLVQAGTGPDDVAEVRVKTPFMMRGYLVDGKVASAFDDDGFFRTGDLGYLQHGRLQITGRENDIVKKGGEFVPLLLVEDTALRQPGVAMAAAVAVPDEFWGHRIVLFYVPVAGHDIDQIDSALAAAFDEQLRKVEQPDKIIPVPHMPATAIGKPIKRDLVRRYTL